MSPADVPGEFWAWLEYGKARGWCSDPGCSTHDPIPMTEEEEQEWADGYDPCIPVVRIWAD